MPGRGPCCHAPPPHRRSCGASLASLWSMPGSPGSPGTPKATGNGDPRWRCGPCPPMPESGSRRRTSVMTWAGPAGFAHPPEHPLERVLERVLESWLRAPSRARSIAIPLVAGLVGRACAGRPRGDLFRGAAGQLRAVGLRARDPHAFRRATIILLPGPEFAVFDGQALYAPIQTRHTKLVCYGERRSRFKPPGRARTVLYWQFARPTSGAMPGHRAAQSICALCRFTVENHDGNIQGGA